MKINERALYLCQEFTDFALFDETRSSLIVNIQKKYFRTVKKEVERLGFKLFFVKAFEDTDDITCGFKLEN